MSYEDGSPGNGTGPDGRERGAPPAVSVVIPPGTGPRDEARTRECLARDAGPDHELLKPGDLLADGGSAAGGRLVRLNAAVAMNMAAGRAAGQTVAFLGPDLEPLPGWTAAVHRALEQDPRLRVMVGRTLQPLNGCVAVAEAALDGGAPGPDAPGGGPCAVVDGCSLHCAARSEALADLGGLAELWPASATVHRALGGMAAGGGARVVPDAAALRRPSSGMSAFLRRQFELGMTSYYAPPTGPSGRHLAEILELPARAVRLLQNRRELAPVLMLLGLGSAARLLGAVAARLRGGRTAEPLPSALVGPPSPSLAAEGRQTALAASVVVPVYGQPEWLWVCLHALSRQDMDEPYEVVVIYDGDESFLSEVREAFPGVRCLRCRSAGGPGASRNLGIESARGECVAFTDDDCLPVRHWLRRTVEACRRHGGPVRGWLVPADVYSCISRGIHVHTLGVARPCKGRLTRGAGAGNMCLPRRLLQDHHARFAEGVFGAEEMTLLDRLPAEKRAVLLEPGAVVLHLRGGTLRRFLAHYYTLGTGSGRVRARLQMRGSFAARHPWLAPLLGPGRTLLTGLRTLRHTPGRFPDFVRLSPLILCRYTAFALGFMVGARRAKRAGAKQIEEPVL
jgi:hypothetical protein